MTSAQCRAARALLDWGRVELKDASGVSGNTIARIEQGKESIPATMTLLIQAFDKAGVVLTQNGGVEFKQKN